MAIHPLPQFEADLKAHLDEEDRRVYESLRPPKTVVVRFGAMKLVGEFPYGGDVKPGCGSKLVVRTFRGTELGEMLTTTCSNNGCGKSVSRQDLLRYVENSGGRDYPFFTDGRVLRVATRDDLDRQAAIEQSKHELRARVRDVAERVGLAAKIVEVEPVLGGETVTVFYLSEERVELRDLVREASRELRTHVEARHVGARDEARLTADYEKCGQYCCCKNFLKVLRPVSMKSAKTQKATLDPLKISGRCGRLMCCLRYEDQTYEELRKKLPRKKSRVGTPDGDGLVLDGQILTQLVLVELDELGSDGKVRQVAVAVEDLTEPTNAVAPPRPAPPDAPRLGGPQGRDARPQAQGPRPAQPRPEQPRPQRPHPPTPPSRATPANRDDEIDALLSEIDDDLGPSGPSRPQGPVGGGGPGGGGGGGRRRRRRRGGPGRGPNQGPNQGPPGGPSGAT